MIGQILKYTASFFLYVLLQVLVLNNIDFLGFINPYLYIFFIISLPIALPRIPALFIGFFMGLCIDMFSNTPGVHTFATVLAVFIRYYLLLIFETVENFYYILIMVIVHHTTLFLMESFAFTPGFIYVKIICSIAFTLLPIGGIKLLRPKQIEIKKPRK